jgi:hypothetical protein
MSVNVDMDIDKDIDTYIQYKTMNIDTGHGLGHRAWKGHGYI